MKRFFNCLIWLLVPLLLQGAVVLPWQQPVALYQTTTQPITQVNQEINAMIGDPGLRSLHKAQLEETELQKIQAHLAYVERFLRAYPPASLSSEQQQARTQNLDHLRRYWQTGNFPQQSAYAGRRPRLIDTRGHLCAVGYLISRSGQPELIQALNQRFEYAYLQTIQDPALTRWVASSGLSLEELAMIQPTYEGWGGGGMIEPSPVYIQPTPFSGQFMPVVGLATAFVSLIFFAGDVLLADEAQLYSWLAAESSLVLSGVSWLVAAAWGSHDPALAALGGSLGILMGVIGGVALIHTTQQLMQLSDHQGLEWGMLQRHDNAYLGMHYALLF